MHVCLFVWDVVMSVCLCFCESVVVSLHVSNYWVTTVQRHSFCFQFEDLSFCFHCKSKTSQQGNVHSIIKKMMFRFANNVTNFNARSLFILPSLRINIHCGRMTILRMRMTLSDLKVWKKLNLNVFKVWNMLEFSHTPLNMLVFRPNLVFHQRNSYITQQKYLNIWNWTITSSYLFVISWS